MSINEIGSINSSVLLMAGIMVGDKLYDKVALAEISGKEEDILTEKNGSASDKITRILTGCINSLDSSEDAPSITEKNHLKNLVRQMAIGDRIFLFIKLRVISLDEHYIMLVSPEEGEDFKPFKVSVNLEELEPVSLEDKKERTRTAVTNNGQKVVIKLMTGVEEEMLSKISDSKTRISSTMVLRIVSVDEKHIDVEGLQKLSMRDRKAIRDVTRKFDVGLDTELIVTEPVSGKELKRELDITQPGFFFPLETSEN